MYIKLMDNQSWQDPEAIEKTKAEISKYKKQTWKTERIKSYTKYKPCRFALQPSSVKATDQTTKPVAPI
jgi:hypothetical protein